MSKLYCTLHKTDYTETWPNVLECAVCLEEALQASQLYKLTITGQCPSGKNAVIVTRTGHRFPQARFVQWRTQALVQIKKQIKKLKTIDRPVSVMIEYWSSDKRRRDVPGIIDALWHLLEKACVIKDDKLLGDFSKRVSFINKGLDKTNPRVNIYIYE